jgi:hypothetical protein
VPGLQRIAVYAADALQELEAAFLPAAAKAKPAAKAKQLVQGDGSAKKSAAATAKKTSSPAKGKAVSPRSRMK